MEQPVSDVAPRVAVCTYWSTQWVLRSRKREIATRHTGAQAQGNDLRAQVYGGEPSPQASAAHGEPGLAVHTGAGLGGAGGGSVFQSLALSRGVWRVRGHLKAWRTGVSNVMARVPIGGLAVPKWGSLLAAVHTTLSLLPCCCVCPGLPSGGLTAHAVLPAKPGQAILVLSSSLSSSS